ncbi:hypothetical protein P168DRAFT_97566 [Aspergillus campestris IBT 28561]|uniref:Uncharacterized protein n=1 Tax=Aspergillus campestris (strain IBT 28561) TaxID=1392248 RepID=A0A2I1DCC3_ASPC2|nr:uncharacterized protein P168DRAFT_97566 [Aspergillus campestris IBT 28561]PKY07514.1 hypothetical protein P168DRAFT_97566 [Aspergillus campestris IBT 28561]
MANSLETQEKRAIYRSTLRSIKERITKLEDPQISAQEASDAGIQQASLSLEDKSDYPYFFSPFKGTLTPAKRPDYPTCKNTLEDHMNVKALYL